MGRGGGAWSRVRIVRQRESLVSKGGELTKGSKGGGGVHSRLGEWESVGGHRF